jgi:hypothetical protein
MQNALGLIPSKGREREMGGGGGREEKEEKWKGKEKHYCKWGGWRNRLGQVCVH